VKVVAKAAELAKPVKAAEPAKDCEVDAPKVRSKKSANFQTRPVSAKKAKTRSEPIKDDSTPSVSGSEYEDDEARDKKDEMPVEARDKKDEMPVEAREEDKPEEHAEKEREDEDAEDGVGEEVEDGEEEEDDEEDPEPKKRGGKTVPSESGSDAEKEDNVDEEDAPVQRCNVGFKLYCSELLKTEDGSSVKDMVHLDENFTCTPFRFQSLPKRSLLAICWP